MKKIATLLFAVTFAFGQNGAPAVPYYNGFNWTLSGIALKTELATKTITKHTNILTYSQTENSILVTDLDPTDATNTNLLLVYGFSTNTCLSSASDDKDHRTRDKNMQDAGTADPCLWNKEHTFPKTLGVPNLGTSGPGADAHHIRAADKKRNADRDNDKYFSGSGNSFETGFNWYPGDEWKGDIARMMMYMYLRYGTQCLPKNVGVGAPVASDADMIDLFLTWNSQDPVSAIEDARNTYHGNTSNTYAQGNRNPFIDNPYLATVIWGGPIAQNRWPNIFLGNNIFEFANIYIYPNPSSNHKINIDSSIKLDHIQLVNLNGQLLLDVKNPVFNNNSYTLENLPQGFYFLKLYSNNKSITKKIIVN